MSAGNICSIILGKLLQPEIFVQSSWASYYNTSLIGKVWPLAFTLGQGSAFPLNPGVVADRQVAPSLAVNPSCRTTSESTDTCLDSTDPPISSCVSDKSSSNVT